MLYEVTNSVSLDINEFKSFDKMMAHVGECAEALQLPQLRNDNVKKALKLNTRMKFRKGKQWLLITRKA